MQTPLRAVAAFLVVTFAASVMPAFAQITKTDKNIGFTPSGTNSVAFDRTNNVYLVVSGPNFGDAGYGMFVTSDGVPTGTAFLITDDYGVYGAWTGWYSVAAGGPANDPVFLVTYLWCTSMTNIEHRARVVRYRAGSAPLVSPAITIVNTNGAWQAWEKGSHAWDGDRFVTVSYIGVAGAAPQPMLHHVDVNGVVSDEVMLGDYLDFYGIPSVACSVPDKVCMITGFAGGYPFGAGSAGGSYFRLVNANTLQPLAPMDYLETDHGSRSEDQAVLFDSASRQFLATWLSFRYINGRQYWIDNRVVGLDGAKGPAAPADGSRSFGPGAGESRMAFNPTTGTTLLASKWSNDPTRPYDFYAAELGSTGALIRPTNIVRLMECWNGADCPTPVFNPAVAANPINGSWFVDTWYSRGAAWLVQGTPNGTPPPPPPGPSLGKVAPANGATGQPTSVTLSWGAVTGATDYQVCADTTNDGVCAGGAWTSVGLATTHVLSGLSAATTFYWQVQATVDSQTLTGNAGAWWSFVTLSIPVAAVTDFNGNGSPDLVWRNAATGQNAVWYMNGTTLAGEQALPPVTDTRWQIAVVADLDADGKADLVWRNTGTGDNAVWHMNGSTIVSNLMLPPVPDTLWQIVAAADFSGDGKPDLVWRHRVNGQNVVWYLNGTQVVQVQSLPSLGNPAWQIAGAADFDRDGSVDLLWRHGITGQNAIWLMNGVSFRADAPPLPTVPDPAWRVGQVVDLNSDGHADIVWRHSTLGHNGVWLMNGVTVGAQAQLPGAVPAWHSPGPPTVASSDFDGNGTSDILWRNTATGDNAIWRMDGTSLLLSTSLAPVANTAWQIVASGDFNGDTQPDVVWRNAVSGRVVVWLMQGTVLQEVVDVPPPADPQCEIAAAADMNGDGMVDLVWRNAFTGTNFVWLMGGTALLEERPLPSVGSAWRLVAAADFNWDGKPDLVWRKVTTGQNEIWFMNGTSWASAKVLPPAPNPAWQLVQAGDFNRDGHADLVWRNYLTGRNVVWLMRGATCISEVDLPPVPDPNWKVMRDRQ